MPTPIQEPDAIRSTTLTVQESAESTLPSQDDLQARFDAAMREGVSPCMWVPPEWDDLLSNEPQPDPTKPKRLFPDNCSDAGDFANNAAERIEKMIKGGEKKDAKPVKKPESPPDDDSWPHPFGDTSHVDETEFSVDDHARLKSTLTGDQVLLSKLSDIVGESSPGMRRIKGIYNWVLYRATVFMGELNAGLKDEDNYEDARTNYIEFLRDLDDHEPEKGTKHSPRDIAKKVAAEKAVQIIDKPAEEIFELLQPLIEEALDKLGNGAERRANVLAKQLSKALARKKIEEIMELSQPSLDMTKKESASGYGRAIKWACIDPVIVKGKIVGTRVVAKWNPHMCSSGIPIQHDKP